VIQQVYAYEFRNHAMPCHALRQGMTACMSTAHSYSALRPHSKPATHHSMLIPVQQKSFGQLCTAMHNFTCTTPHNYACQQPFWLCKTPTLQQHLVQPVLAVLTGSCAATCQSSEGSFVTPCCVSKSKYMYKGSSELGTSRADCTTETVLLQSP
jgi:hypothetical protein